MSSPPEAAPHGTTRPGPVGRFVAAHLHDYNRSAARVWLLILAAGALALGLALWQLLRLEPAQWPQFALLLAFVAVAACVPIQIPRTKYSIGVGDIFVFALLATLGTPAAVLAAAVEGAVGAFRTSKRLTSRLGTPACAAAAMGLAGMLHAGLSGALQKHFGLAEAPAGFAALAAIALPYFAASVLPLTWMVMLKRGERLKLRRWAADYAWLAAIYLASALIAGVLYMNSRQFGGAVLALAALAAAGVVLLINTSLKRQESERQEQERRLAQAQQEAELSQRRFTAAFSHAAIGMAIVGHDGRVLQANRALGQLIGRSEAELLRCPFVQLLHADDRALFEASAAPLAREGRAFSIELRCGGAGEREVWVSMHCSRFADPGGHGDTMIYQLHDITSRRQAEGELQHIAYHDDLTDLANRNCFHERLHSAVERSRLDPGHRFAVLFIDLDHFKVVNDSLGHHAGNEMLKTVAQRLARCVRPGDLVARLGGDEFAVLLENLHERDAALALANRLLDATARPMQINGTEVAAGASIGVTLSDLGYRSTDEVLRDADLAMYEAKAAGRHRVAMFDTSMLERVTDRLQLEGDLRRAIGDGQLSLVFQPLFELSPQRLCGFEALARWVHPVRGPVSPAVFIALAEESGHIEALTTWVLDKALAQLAAWQQGGLHAGLTMNVNISGRDLADPALAGRVDAALQRHGVKAQSLTLEITETTLMGHHDVALQTLHRLRRLGVQFGIDDFGTGYSSLAYLSTLPIDTLKIDRSFINGLERQPQNVEIVRAVLTLGRSLGKRIVAEGVETTEQLAILRQLGVEVGQGYLLARPQRADQVERDLLGPVNAMGGLP